MKLFFFLCFTIFTNFVLLLRLRVLPTRQRLNACVNKPPVAVAGQRWDAVMLVVSLAAMVTNNLHRISPRARLAAMISGDSELPGLKTSLCLSDRPACLAHAATVGGETSALVATLFAAAMTVDRAAAQELLLERRKIRTLHLLSMHSGKHCTRLNYLCVLRINEK